MTTILHVLDESEHPAALTPEPDAFQVGALLCASMWVHLDGTPGKFGEAVVCDTCGKRPMLIRVDMRPKVFVMNRPGDGAA